MSALSSNFVVICMMQKYIVMLKVGLGHQN